MTEQLTFDPPEKREGKLIFSMVLPMVLPSWNEMLGMEQWQRYAYKKTVADAFLSALRQSAKDSSMMTTSVRSSWSIYADTLESYQAMRLEQRRLRQLKKRQSREAQKEPKLKSSKSKVPF